MATFILVVSLLIGSWVFYKTCCLIIGFINYRKELR